RLSVLEFLTLLMDRRYATGGMKRSCLLSMVDRAALRTLGGARGRAGWFEIEGASPGAPPSADSVAIVDARGYPPEGPRALARAVVAIAAPGWRRLVIFGARGQRFIGCGLGSEARGIRIDLYGSSGDYLASGMDGPSIRVHGSGQDQLAQIM